MRLAPIHNKYTNLHYETIQHKRLNKFKYQRSSMAHPIIIFFIISKIYLIQQSYKYKSYLHSPTHSPIHHNPQQMLPHKHKHKLKQKHIQDFLQDIQDFKYGQKQKISLQQHMTPPDIAAKLLFYIYNNQQIQNSIIADIGIGTGMLICGAIYLQAQYVIGFEIDQQYINSTRQMLEQKVQGANYDLILVDVRYVKFRQMWKNRLVDIVIMNPPFGTKQAGIDVMFLEFAMKICEGNIYSMHKSSTRKFLGKFCQERGYNMEVLFQVKFPLKKRFKGYHKKQVAFTEVDIIVLRPTKQLVQMRKNKAAEEEKKKNQRSNEQNQNGDGKTEVIKKQQNIQQNPPKVQPTEQNPKQQQQIENKQQISTQKQQ